MRDHRMSRRAVLGALVAGASACAAVGLAGCGDLPPRVALATGEPQDAYRRLGEALCTVWRADLGVASTALPSAGSVENLAMLAAGRADVAFCTLDVAADGGVEGARPRHPLQSLARVHDEAVQVVVPAESPVRRLADLRGRRVSVGVRNSGTQLVAPRLLATVDMSPERDLVGVDLGLEDSCAALLRGDLDALIWAGAVPTTGLDALAARRPVRLLDLSAETAALRRRYPAYDAAIVPERTYRILEPITTVSVRNLLMVSSTLDPTLARGLTAVLLERRATLAAADAAGGAIDPRTAIGTEPVELHPGAVAAYRAVKGL